jgi:hypothetical protein
LRWRRFVGSLAEEVDTDVFDGGLHSVETSSLALGMQLVDQVIDLALVQLEPRVNISLVYVDRALPARHDEVQVYSETHPRVEGHPVENEVEV